MFVAERYTHRLESSDLFIGAAEWSHVIHRESSVLLEEGAVQAPVRPLRDPLESPVLGRLEVDGSRPVIAEVLCVDTTLRS